MAEGHAQRHPPAVGGARRSLVKDDGRNDTAVTIDKIITGYEYMVQKAIKMDGFGQSRHEQMGIAVIDGDRDVFGEYGE